MKAETTLKRTRSRIVWIAVLLAVIFFSAGGYYWYEQVNVKYDRITNARRV